MENINESKEILERMGLMDRRSDIKRSLGRLTSALDNANDFVDEILSDIKNNPGTRAQFVKAKEKIEDLLDRIGEIQQGIEKDSIQVS